jgi:hypothetical protein
MNIVTDPFVKLDQVFLIPPEFLKDSLFQIDVDNWMKRYMVEAFNFREGHLGQEDDGYIL